MIRDMMLPRFLAVYLFGVAVAGAAPVLRNDVVTVNLRQSVSFPVLKNDSKGIAPGSVRIATKPRFGTATVNPDGTIYYRNKTGNSNLDSFTYKLNGGTATAKVIVRLSKTLRVPPLATNLPLQPPVGDFALVDAFPLEFNQPICLATPPNESRRLFVLEKPGVVKVIPNVAATNPTAGVFLDLAALLTSRGETLLSDGEQGALGLAFHPRYASNGLFYIFYSVQKGGQAYERVAQFSVSATDPNRANPGSEVILINQLDEATNHNGGCLQFGVDGYLYISVGDEGGGNDGFNNSQRIDKDFFSGILRIDVDRKPGNLAPNPHPSIPRDGDVARYSVPLDNPFVGATSFSGVAINPANLRDEFYAVGLRNPWRFSFDAETGELWCGDVGQNAYEEVDVVAAGGNYGWAYREGKHAGPKVPPAGFTSTDPVVEYTHGDGPNQGYSITGGLVYRGKKIASLVGAYIYADYSSGNLWALTRTSVGPSVKRLLARQGIVSFGTDPATSDLLVCNINEGKILRLRQNAPAANTLPKTLTATGIFSSVKALTLNPGFVAYSPNVPFWSDYALKRRWFSLPTKASKIGWSQDDAWQMPSGTVWVKHFDLETTRGNPATKRRIETRILVRNGTGVYGLSYRWNNQQTEATLVPETGDNLALNVKVAGVNTTQTWHYPGRAECLTCHTQQAGYTLSFNTRQMNHGPSLNGFAGNQIDVLQANGYFSAPVPPAASLPTHYPLDAAQFSVQDRVRSYLAVNCAYCHQAGGTAPTRWDGRPELTLEQTGLLNGELLDNGGDLANKLVAVGDPVHSGILTRILGAQGFSRMPPLATNQIDPQAVNLLTDWIQNYLPTNP